MSKTKMETKVAVADGFYGSGRVRKGETFVAPKNAKARWFKPASEGDVTADKGGSSAILDGHAKDIVGQLSGLTDKELNGLIAAEQAGKMRKGVLAAIGDELANRVGRVGGNEPKAKQPEETDPKTPGAATDDLLK